MESWRSKIVAINRIVSHGFFVIAALLILIFGLGAAVGGQGAVAAAAGDGAAGGVEKPQRIISLSPNITETLFALGAGGRIVGDSDFCKYPAEAAQIPHCGGWSNPNLETISALRPDLIFVLSDQPVIFKFAQAQKIAIEGMTLRSVATVHDGILKIGKLIGDEDRATSLAAHIDGELAKLQGRWKDAGTSGTDKSDLKALPKVFISISRKPGTLASMLTSGGGEFLDETVTLAGGKNVFADVGQRYPTVSKESLIVRQPDVILEITGGEKMNAEQRAGLIADWNAIPSLPAVRNKRVVVLDQDYLLIAGPRLPLIVEALLEAIHPELGGGFAMQNAK